jgi:hypothetical protein
LPGKLKPIGGSMSDDWNSILANQTIEAIWYRANADAEEIKVQRRAAIEALVGIKPGDELEGMIARTTRRLPQRLDGVLSARHDRRSDVRRSAGKPKPSEQALPDICGTLGIAQSPPRQGDTESYGGARPRP